MKLLTLSQVLAVVAASSFLDCSLQAASIPGLFGTGVDDSQALLAAGAVDPHYKLITSADTNFPGPNTIVVNQDFPIAGEAGNGPWLTNGPSSKWIGPQADQTCCGQGTAGGNGGNLPGDYVYRINFNLTGFDLSTVQLTGQWACDSEGVDIKINGTSTGQKIPPYPPQPSETWHPFNVASGFVDGTNTLDFVINRSSGKYPTGLRADLSGTGIPLPQPVPIAGIFGTGLDDKGVLLAAGAVDPHYKLITSADTNFPGPNTIVVNQDFPIAGEAGNGPWLTNGPSSKWIGPQADQTCCGQGTAGGNGGNLPGDYVYRLSFNLTGFDLGTVKLTGQWACDSEGVDIKINGTSTGQKIPPYPPQPSESWHPFTVTSGFVDGTNTLDFVINRSSGKYPTGLRAEVSGFAATPGGGNAAPTILVQPISQAVKVGASATLLVSAKGNGLNYQWRLNGTNLSGAISARLSFDSVKTNDFGIYDVVVSNQAGKVTSEAATLLLAVPVPGLFNTGTDNGGALLADAAVDPHFKLIASPDPNFPGPNAVVVTQGAPISPDGTWAENGPNSRWIAPQADQSASGGNLSGYYTYRFSFDLQNLDPATVILNGQWAVAGAAGGQAFPAATLTLNGKLTDLQIGPFEPDRLLRPFTLSGGFVSGVNTLDFIVSVNGNPDVAVTTGARFELAGVGGQLPPNTPPSFLTQLPSQEQLVIEGDSLTLTVAARGSSPLSYQWRHNGTNITGATSYVLQLAAVKAADGGQYDIVVSNPAGSATSSPATLTVLGKVPGLFNTGVAADGTALADLSVDPHYQLTVNANDPASKDVVVLDSTVIPGNWLAASATSKWVGPWADPNANPSNYVYRTTFDLTGFDPATVVLKGGWAMDNTGTDLLLNGTSTGVNDTNVFINLSPFQKLSPFVVTSGFKAGVNTLDFVVNNAGADVNPTGLRVDGLHAGGLPPGSNVPVSLAVSLSAGQVTVSWPASAAGFKLYSASGLSAPAWSVVTSGIVVSGGQNVYQTAPNQAARFFRLQK